MSVFGAPESFESVLYNPESSSDTQPCRGVCTSIADYLLIQSFMLSTLPYTTVVPPLLLLVLRPLTFGRVNYLPSGPTAIIFALLAQYHVMIPRTYTYRLAGDDPTSSSSSSARPYSPVEKSLTYTDKTLTYLVASQLALSQLPGSALSAAVGWAVGYAWRNELLPGWTARRVPAETNPTFRSSVARSNAFVNESVEGATTGTRAEAESLHCGTSLRTSVMQAESTSRSM